RRSSLRDCCCQSAKPPEAESRFTRRSGLGEIHVEFGHPVIVLVRIDEHLLHFPGAFFFGGNNIGMTKVPRVWIEADILMLDVVIFHRFFQAFGSLGLIIGICWWGEMG